MMYGESSAAVTNAAFVNNTEVVSMVQRTGDSGSGSSSNVDAIHVDHVTADVDQHDINSSMKHYTENTSSLQDSLQTVALVTMPQKQTSTPLNENIETSSDGDKWLQLSRQVRGALAVKNVVTKQPNKRRLGKKSPTDIDPFLRRFSTREIGLNSPININDSPLKSLNELEEGCCTQDTVFDIEDIDDEVKEQENTSLFLDVLIDIRILCTRWLSSTKVFDPDGSFLYYWLYFVITAIRYNIWAIILRFAFEEAQHDHKLLWWTLDSIADFIYIFDIFINSRVGFVEEGILVKDAKLATKRYLKSFRFYMDILSVIPLELLYLAVGIQPILRFPRLLKVYKSQEIKNRIEGRASHPTGVRVFFLVHLMFVMIHWNAGIYFLICRHEGFGTNDWVYPALNGTVDSLTQKYVRSFYWSLLTLTTIGDLPTPVTNLEYFYTIICYLSGVFVFAMIVGNAGSIILNMDSSRLEFEKQRDNAKSYMEIHNVPRELHRRVLKWYDYSWSRGRLGEGGDLNSLHILPDKMKTEIALHVHLETLKKVTFLQNCEPEFLHELLLKMKLHIYTPGDLIIRHGEIAREMYLMSHGRIEVISETGKVLKELGPGDFFGEIGILSLSAGQNRRTADVRSIGYTECFVLSKDDVLGEIEQFPEAQRILAEYGKKRLENTNDDPRLVKLDSRASTPITNERLSFGHAQTTKNSPLKNVHVNHTSPPQLDMEKKQLTAKQAQMISSFLKTRNKNHVKQDTSVTSPCDVGVNMAANPAQCCRTYENVELDSCLNSLENVKTILQNTIENDIKKYKECMQQLKDQLFIEHGKLTKAEQEMTTQRCKLNELVQEIDMLKQDCLKKDKLISELTTMKKEEQGTGNVTEDLQHIDVEEENGSRNTRITGNIHDSLC